MKKRYFIVVMTAALTVSLTGCSSSGAAYLKGLKASNYVTPCDYIGIEVEVDASDYTVSESYVDYLVEYAVSSTAYEAEVTDRDDVQDGDIVDIDYVGTMDGEEFDGGSSEGYELEIGSGTFIDGFEEGLIGCTVGETVDLELTFPEDYSSEDLAGQDVIFTVTINSILETITPEFTDEWVVEQGIDGVETTDDFWQYYYDYLEEDAQESYEEEIEDQLSEYLIENSTYKKDLPQGMVDRVTETVTEYYQEYADYYGYELDEFMQYFYGTEEGEYEEYINEIAEESVKELLVMKAISDKEGLNPSKSEWQTQLSIYAAYYGYDSIDDFSEDYDAESIRENMMISNVLDFLMESVVVVEPSEDEEEESDDVDSEEDVEETDESAEEADEDDTADADDDETDEAEADDSDDDGEIGDDDASGDEEAAEEDTEGESEEDSEEEEAEDSGEGNAEEESAEEE